MSNPEKASSFHIGRTEDSNTAVMNIFIFFDDLSKSRNGKQLMKALTSTLKVVVPLIEENAGRVIKVSGSGISAVFERSAEDALVCGISICQRVDAGMNGSDEIRVSVGITYGRISICDVVCGSFSTIVAVSEAMELTVLLSVACKKADASMLVTESLANHVSGFQNRFASRKIGLIYYKAEKKPYTLYDVFDSDTAEKKYSKRRSRLLFEKGVEHFLEGRAMQARSCFIELLKYDRSDVVAKKYILMCDKVLSGEGEDPEDKYLSLI